MTLRLKKFIFLMASLIAPWVCACQMITHIEINEGGIIGRLSLPDTTRKYPAIFSVAGSDGSFSLYDGKFFAPHGFLVFKLAYFKQPGLPDELSEIPLEYIMKGFEWFRRHKNVDSEQIFLKGGSKGAELILLFSSLYKIEVKGVIAVAPSNVVWQHVKKSPENPKSSWTFNGKPVPFLLFKFNDQNLKKGLDSGYWHDLYWESFQQVKHNRSTIIPVENIRAPVLLLSGADDRIWPSSSMSDSIIARLDRLRFPYQHRHIRYDNVGHQLWHSTPYQGGIKEANDFADTDSYKQMLFFMESRTRK